MVLDVPDASAETGSARGGTGTWRSVLLLIVLTPPHRGAHRRFHPHHRRLADADHIPIYGAGTLLVRELVRRAGRGWAAILLLGLAYGLVEEGLALQSLSSPTLYHVADWAPRVFGLNSAYTEAVLPYHAVWSVALPILLTEIVFPRTRSTPWLRRRGLIVAGVCYALGVALVRLSVPPKADPGYTAPTAVILGCLLAIALLTVAALRLVPPPEHAHRRLPPRPPRGLWVGWQEPDPCWSWACLSRWPGQPTRPSPLAAGPPCRCSPRRWPPSSPCLPCTAGRDGGAGATTIASRWPPEP